MRFWFYIALIFILALISSCDQTSNPVKSGKDTTGIISGKLTDSTSRYAVIGATITTTPATSSVTSDISGNYSITLIPPGMYNVNISKTGYSPVIINNVQVNKDSISTINSRLIYIIPMGGIVAYYPFNGNANDESGNGFNGTVQGATLTSDRFGITDRAYSFNGNDNYIQTSVLPDLKTRFSYSVWIKNTDQTFSTKRNNFGCYGLEGFYGISWDFGYIPSLSAVSIYENGNYNNTNVSLINGWNHIAIVYKDTIKTLYVNGILAGSKNVSSPLNIYFNNKFRIGGHFFDVTQYFKGMIDDARIYARDLTPEEVLILYHEGGWQ